MITVEEKLNAFAKLALEKAQNEYEMKKKEIDERNNRVIAEHKEEIRKKADKIIEDTVNRGEIEKNRLISKAKVSKKRLVLSKKEELLDRLINKVEKMSVSFTQGDNYRAYFENSLSEVLENLKDKESIILFLTDNDRDKFNEILEKLIEAKGFDVEKVEIQRLDPRMIGGVIGVDEQKTVSVDCSIKTQIDDDQDVIGQMLYDVLEL